jgi:hypothetical protein
LLKKLIIDYKRKRIRYLDIELKYNNEFLILLKQEQDLYKQLQEVLPPEYLSLLLHYNDAVTEIEIFKQKFFYHNGYNDAEFINGLLNGKSYKF